MKKQNQVNKEKPNKTTLQVDSEKKNTQKTWYLIDAKGKILGRLSTEIAKILMGKDKAGFVRYLDSGDNVVVINASKIAVSGNKEVAKKYYRYSGYPSGLKVTNLENLRERKPQDIIYHAVSGMLPKNRLGRSMIKKLYVYPRGEHPHEAQTPKELEVVDA